MVRNTASWLLTGSLLLSSTVLAQAQEFRQFADQQGRSIRAKLTSVQNGQVTIVREDGATFTLPLAQLSVADQEYIKSQGSAVTATTPATASPMNAPVKAGPNDKVLPEEVNKMAGMTLFSDTILWNSPAKEVAEQLKLRQESETKLQSSFRAYPSEGSTMFGARPYSIALYALEGKATNISIVFANKGDLFGSKGSGEQHFDKNTPPEQAAKLLKEAMAKDITAITDTLKKTLGEPQKQRFGDGEGRRNVFRWDWRGHSILLSEAEGEYVGVQIETNAFADSGGKIKRTPEALVKARALENIDKRKNGDVVIGEIPMVDQGPKGYCVPATAERAMRYLDVPADMYVLAMAGGTGFGGGTSVQALLQGVDRDIRRKGRSFNRWDGEIQLRDLAKHIDKGVPVIWALFSTEKFNKTANDRTKERQGVTDWTDWQKKMTEAGKTTTLAKDTESGHVVLITGYNKDTGEISFSDSWGENYKERWITLAEAEKVSQQSFWVVGF